MMIPSEIWGLEGPDAKSCCATPPRLSKHESNTVHILAAYHAHYG